MSAIVTLIWTDFKVPVAAKGLHIQMIESSTDYHLLALDNNFTLRSTIPKTTPANSDQTDFETNFKPDVNKKIRDDIHIVGGDDTHRADVFLQSGVKRLQTTALATIESLLGKAVLPFTAIEITDVGTDGDILRTQIVPDSIDISTTKLAGDDDHELAKRHRDELNADGGFTALFVADVPRDSHQVCIFARLIQTLRPNSGDVVVTSSGTMTHTLFSDKIIDHDLGLALFAHPRDCTKGTISIIGEVASIAAGRPPARILLWSASDLPGQGGENPRADMSIDGSSTDREFKLTNNPDFDTSRDFLVTELRIEATAGTIAMSTDKYIEVARLTVGQLIQVQSDGVLEYDENLKSTPDIFHAFVFGEGSRYDLQSTGSGDSLVAIFARPFFIRKAGSFGTSEDVISVIRDNLSTSSIDILQMSAVGFFED